MDNIADKYYQLSWLLYQAASELAELTETEEFKQKVPIKASVAIRIKAIETRNAFSKHKDVFDSTVNIVELVKRLKST